MTTILKNIEVPTGNILIVRGEKGRELECLSIGDYGKQANIKADFLGLTDEINGVKSDSIMPLSEKWVVTVSTQYGCSMKCKFCDVPKVGPGFNATKNDILMRMLKILELLRIMGFPEDYVLVGTQAEKKKFIGNAVEVNMARVMCVALGKKLLELKQVA